MVLPIYLSLLTIETFPEHMYLSKILRFKTFRFLIKDASKCRKCRFRESRNSNFSGRGMLPDPIEIARLWRSHTTHQSYFFLDPPLNLSLTLTLISFIDFRNKKCHIINYLLSSIVPPLQ